MTQAQLDLLIEYINKKVRVAVGHATHRPCDRETIDRLPEIIGELEATVTEAE